MPEPTELDRTYDFILRAFVADGTAPHFTAIARHFGVSPDEGRRRLHALMEAGLPNWLFPSTDLIASFAPFNNLPTQYRISVDGQQRWFAQCGLESLAMTWMFPGKTVVVDAPCLDCGEPLRVAVRDGAIEGAEPRGIWFYVDVPFRAWRTDLPFS
ncbi:MAG TPA: organomercurial lyase [Candidatus Sulfotelmatobacter sp.]|nr:organomercurial lyase [Candidatus Sulfotelmatobacter sp.]